MNKMYVLCLASLLGCSYPFVSGCQSRPKGDGRPEFKHSTIIGTVSYMDRMALPSGSQLVVELVDVTARKPVVVASRMVLTQTQIPVPFEMVYDPEQIDSAARYALRARLTMPGADAPTWVTAEPMPIVPLSRGDRASLLLVRTRSAN